MPVIDDLFTQLRSEGRKALMPFVTAGDPNLETTAAVLTELSKRGAALCELGIPYSDPIADGPVIQASYTRALENGVKLADIIAMLSHTTPKLTAPVVTMVSYAIIYRHGLRDYLEMAKESGVAGLIVPDLPVDEAESLSALCGDVGLSLIQLVTPTTPNDRAVRIAETSSGFIYYVSVAGITGERKALPADLVDRVGWLREQTPLPVCIGFGISEPEHVRQLAPVADGLIVGSAIVRRIAALGNNRQECLQEVGNYVSSLFEALNE